MSARSALSSYEKGEAWWDTKISSIKKNEILIRGFPVEELIGSLSYSQMLYLLLTGDLLTERKAYLLESVLIAGADHGPRAPSIAAARMAATCGISFNSTVATGINVLGDTHGGAAEKAMDLFYSTNLIQQEDTERSIELIVEEQVEKFEQEGLKLPGIGHQLHNDDPRVKKLYQLATEIEQEGEISGDYLKIAELYRKTLERFKNKKITMNVDGVSAAIQCELGIPTEAAKGIFAMSRGLGIMAHAFEEQQNDVLIKGPCPDDEGLVKYSGSSLRHLDN